MPDITSANAVILISVPGILPVPQQLQGFAADDIFDVDDVDATDTVMGVDGILSGGVILASIPQNFSLQADSPSISFFDAWYWGQRGLIVTFPAQATITFTGIGTSYGCINGYLSRYKPMADAKKTLMPRKFRITWQATPPTPVGLGG